MVDQGIASIIGILLLFRGAAQGYVIPGELLNPAEGGKLIPRTSDDQYVSGSAGMGDDEMDVNLLLFSLVTMVLVYSFICCVYIIIRFIVRTFMTRQTGISLLNDDYESRRHRRTTEQLNVRWPSALDDPEIVKSKLAKMSPEEQFYYKQGEEYIKQNPPLIIPHALSSHEQIEDPIIDETTRQYISDEGAYAWEFQPDPNLPNDTIMVENKTEITFLNYSYEASVMTNLPIPRINRVYYCEFKIFELNNNNGADFTSSQLDDQETISFGLSTSPYPYFRLPGKHHHSIAYDSNGARRFNDSFELDPKLGTLFPRLEKGDVVGIGYRSNSGTVFFTRNGKKLKEDSVGGHLRGWKFKYVYPIVGANVPCKVHVNFGTYGFVYIEANVKKWGYAKSNGTKLPPPSYEEYGQDTLLESGCEDEESDNDSNSSINEGDILDSQGELLPPPPSFEYSTSPVNASSIAQNNEEIDLDSMPVEPPNYSDDEQFPKPKSNPPKVGSSLSHINEDSEQFEEDAQDFTDNEHEYDLESENGNDHNDENENNGNTNGNTIANQFIQD